MTINLIKHKHMHTFTHSEQSKIRLHICRGHGCVSGHRNAAGLFLHCCKQSRPGQQKIQVPGDTERKRVERVELRLTC